MTPLNVVTLQQAKDYIRVDYGDDDELITGLINSAVGLVEQTTNYRLYQRNEVIFRSGFYYYNAYQFPINSASVVNHDSADTFDYQVKYFYEPLRVNLAWWNGYFYWDSWESFMTNYTYTIHTRPVTFVLTLDVGYTDTAQIPTDLITAIKQIISFTYENRDMTKLDLPSNITLLLANYRRFATLL